MSGVASLGMYDAPWLRAENDRLWAVVRGGLGADAPAALDRTRSLERIWNDPDLLLAQTCGYPLMTSLPGVARPVATPVYDLPGCEGGWHCSFVVVRATDRAEGVASLRGRRAAINGWDSNTGMNLLRATVAPHADSGRFFGSVVESGGHVASLAMVRDGGADVAAIDCVTHGLIARHRPALLDGVRVVARTPSTPALPFVTAAGASDTQVAALRAALAFALPWSGLALSRLVGPLDYEPVLALEREAAAYGYPTLA